MTSKHFCPHTGWFQSESGLEINTVEAFALQELPQSLLPVQFQRLGPIVEPANTRGQFWNRFSL